MSTKLKAVILAAGRSSRLYPLTLNIPKCLLKFGNKRIIDFQIEALHQIGIEDVLVVVGYRGDEIRKALANKARFREYDKFESTNNLHTLWSVRDELDEGFICLFSDVLFDTKIIRGVHQSEDDFCMAVDTGRVLEGTMRVQIADGILNGIGSQIPVARGSGNFIGIAGFSQHGARMLCKQMKEMVSNHLQDYYTMAVNALAQKGIRIGYFDVAGLKWAEIDTLKDLESARKRFELF